MPALWEREGVPGTVACSHHEAQKRQRERVATCGACYFEKGVLFSKAVVSLFTVSSDPSQYSCQHSVARGIELANELPGKRCGPLDPDRGFESSKVVPRTLAIRVTV